MEHSAKKVKKYSEQHAKQKICRTKKIHWCSDKKENQQNKSHKNKV
jgi:hypothetical protein